MNTFETFGLPKAVVALSTMLVLISGVTQAQNAPASMPASPATASAASPLRAGAAKVSITPPASAFPMSAPRERDFVGVHDEVFARALVLEDGQRRTTLVSLDVEAVPSDDIVKDVAVAAGVPASQVMVFATHTHNHPLVFYHGHDASPGQLQEIERVRRGAVAATREAVSRLTPARIAFGAGKSWINMNGGEATGVRGGDPAAPSDKTVAVVRVENSMGQPLALLINYATHASVMFRSATRDGGYEVSGDIPGAVSILLEGVSTAAPVVLYSPAAEADQRALFHSVQQADGLLPVKDMGAGGWTLLDVQARRLASSVLDVLDTMPAGESEVTVRADSALAVCPGQRLRLDNGKTVVTPLPDVSIPLSLVRINNIAIASVAGDVATPIGDAIKAAFPQDKLMVVTMTAGAVGYILPDASYQQVTHAVSGSSLKPGCAVPAIVQGLTDLSRRSR